MTTDTTIILKNSSVAGKVPTTSQLSLGELAVNTYDGKLYFKQDTGAAVSIVTISPVTPQITSVNGQVGNVTLTTTNVTEGTNLYFT